MKAQNPISPRGLPRAVLDASVLLSEHRHWLWLLAKEGLYEAAWSTFIVAELVRIRVEHSIARNVDRSVYRQRINDLIHLFNDVLFIANYREASAGGLLADPDDEPILATAIAARASIIVSLNTRDFPPGDVIVGVRFLTPQAFLVELPEYHSGVVFEERARNAGRQVP